MNAQKTVTDLQNRLILFRGRYREIAAANDDFGYSWVMKFAQGHVTNPTINLVESLSKTLDQFENERRR